MLLGTEVRQVEGRSRHQIRAHANGECTIEGTDLLVATGRKANTDRIGLELTGVELDEHGYIRVNERLMTASENIWAMGDCAGSPQFAHVAVDDFLIVHTNLNAGNRTTKNRLIPFCMFTDRNWCGSDETNQRRYMTESNTGWPRWR